MFGAGDGLTLAVASQIIDDGFKHSLIVYEDLQTRGLRLHAAVWEGELRQCPVWTAFGKHPSQSGLFAMGLKLRLTSTTRPQ